MSRFASTFEMAPGGMDRRIERRWRPAPAVLWAVGLAILACAGLLAWGLSPKAGTIKEVVVAEGASVEAGRLLVVVQ